MNTERKIAATITAEAEVAAQAAAVIEPATAKKRKEKPEKKIRIGDKP